MKFGYAITVGNNKSGVVHSRWIVATESGSTDAWYATRCWSNGFEEYDFTDLIADGTLEGAMSAAMSDAASYLVKFKDTHLLVERHEG